MAGHSAAINQGLYQQSLECRKCFVFIVAVYGKSSFWDYIENKGTKKEFNFIEANLITSIFDGLMDQLIYLSESETRFNDTQC